MDVLGVRFLEIVDNNTLQQLQDIFATITRTRTYLVGAKHEQITESAALPGICQLADAKRNCAKRCYENHVQGLCEAAARSGQPELAPCPLTGLTLAAVPLLRGDTYLGSWVIGLMRNVNPLEESICQVAQRLDESPDAVRRQIMALPRIPLDRYESIFGFLQLMTLNLVNLNLSKKMFMKFVDSSGAAMYVSDYFTGELLMLNRQYAGLVGEDIPALIGRPCWQAVGQSGFCTHCPRAALLEAGGLPAEPYSTRRFNERFGQWQQCTHQAIEWVDGRMAHVVTMLDVTKEYQMEQELYQTAYFDGMLSLPNLPRLLKDLEQARRAGEEPSMVFFNISSMKQLNDVYGRSFGDEMLRQVCRWVKKQPFHAATLYRSDGAEFCLLLRNAEAGSAAGHSGENPAGHDAGVDYAHQVGEVIFERFSQAWILNRGDRTETYYSGVSVAVFGSHMDLTSADLPDLVRRVLDISRYEGHVVVYDAPMDAATKEHTRMVMELKNCVKKDMLGFEVHYQPIVEMRRGAWRALEALCRWTSPTGGPVPPDIFIQEAEKNGLIPRIGEWVLDTAVRQMKAFGLDQYKDFFLSVNVSPIQIMEKRFVSLVAGILEKYDFPGSKLTLEVTESTEFTFNEHTGEVIERLGGYGVRLALDDFGTGYSSYGNLRSLPVSFLKTERQMLLGIEQDEYMQYFYSAVSKLGHAGGMKLIAEGIETPEQLEITRRNGADYFQGYLFSRPIPAGELSARLSNFQALQEKPVEARRRI